MRLLFIPVMTFSALLLGGCTSAPNDPTSTLLTDKSPEQYVDCVVPKLENHELDPAVSHSERSSRVVVSSKVAVDKVLETYKTQKGGKVYLYERQLLVSTFMPSSFERAALECL
jgi:type IV pilus biogenesis protein CpaD/CtpE